MAPPDCVNESLDDVQAGRDSRRVARLFPENA